MNRYKLTLLTLASMALAACSDDPVTAPRNAPTTLDPQALIVTGPGFTQVTAGQYRSCSVRADGSYACWGSGPFGEATSGAGPFSQLDAGWYHNCALTSAGAGYCWGYNNYGQLGTGSASNDPSPAAVSGGLVFTVLSIGHWHSCGLTSDGTAYCWGYNGNGEFGNALTTSSNVPVVAAGGQSFASLSADFAHTCGVTSAGEAYCWGYNADGQLGDNTTTSRTVPVAVAGGLTFAKTTAGDRHTCGLTSSGEAYCWGSNQYGQLGDNTNTNRSAPVAVAGGLSFTSMDAGNYHNCALTSAGAAYCWGYNGFSQLGDNTTTSSSVPVAVAGGRTFTAIAMGFGHSCAVKTDSSVDCWGRNTVGESTPPTLPTSHVLPVATFGAPASVDEGSSIALSLDGAGVPGHPEATTFTYAFDCGDGAGYGSYSATNIAACATTDGPATQAVKGTVKDEDGDTQEYTANVTITNVTPTATFVAPTGDVIVTTSFQLDLTSPVDPGTADVVAGFFYSFDCGDGTLAPATGASVTCSAPNVIGPVTVRGRILDKDSDGTTYSATVSIVAAPNLPPVVKPISPVFAAEGASANFRATANDPETQPLTFDWDFGDGSVHGSGASPTHAFPDNGVYTITVQVTDGVNTTTATTKATVFNVAPRGTPVVPTTPVSQGSPFTLALTNIIEPSTVDQGTLEYRFSCGGALGAPQSTPSFSCSQTAVGMYRVQLRVRDKDGGSATYSALVLVVNVAPIVVINNPAPVHIPVGGTLNLSGRFTDPGTGDNPWQARISWGLLQGQTYISNVTPGTNITGLHRYKKAGTYVVKLAVTDKLWGTGEATLTVIVP